MDSYNEEFDNNFENSSYLDQQSKHFLRHKLEVPSMYEIFLLGDDETPVEFIEFVTSEIFKAYQTDFEEFHNSLTMGKSLFCGTYTKEVAETKIKTITDLAFKNQYPLKCIMRKGGKHAI